MNVCFSLSIVLSSGSTFSQRVAHKTLRIVYYFLETGRGGAHGQCWGVCSVYGNTHYIIKLNICAPGCSPSAVKPSSLLESWFIFGCAGSSSLHGPPSSFSVPASHRSGFSCLQSTGSRREGVSSRCTWMGSMVVTHRLSSCGTRAPWHVGSSWVRNRTHVSGASSRILHHWATREALLSVFF